MKRFLLSLLCLLVLPPLTARANRAAAVPNSRDHQDAAAQMADGLRAVAIQNRFVGARQVLSAIGIGEIGKTPTWTAAGTCWSNYTCYNLNWDNPKSDDLAAELHLNYSPSIDKLAKSVEAIGIRFSNQQCVSPESLARDLDGRLDVWISPGLAEPWASNPPATKHPVVRFKTEDGRGVLMGYRTRDHEQQCVSGVNLQLDLPDQYSNAIPSKE